MNSSPTEMFDELKEYEIKNHFVFTPSNSLKEVCNAPFDKNGVYIIYAQKEGKSNLIYIGSSGKKLLDGTIKTRKGGGIKDRLINGHQFGKVPRKRSWPIKMQSENIDALDIYWWITWDEKTKDCPLEIERMLLNSYWDICGILPSWNRRF